MNKRFFNLASIYFCLTILCIMAVFFSIETVLASVVMDKAQVGPASGGGNQKSALNLDKKALGQFETREIYNQLPLYFIENKGQADSEVKYYTTGSGQSIYFAKKGIFFSFNKKTPAEGVSEKEFAENKKCVNFCLTPLSMNKDVDIYAEQLQKGKINYLSGDTSAESYTNIPTYKTVVYKEAYPGIDLKFYGKGAQLEYDVIVKPGADLNQVELRYQGISNLEISEKGDLLVHLSDGGLLTQKKPVAYQEINGKVFFRESVFKIQKDKDGYICGFETAACDKNYTLIIDPILGWSMYFGGGHSNSGNAITVDASGNIYLTGSTSSPDFPVKNALDGTINESGSTKLDIFVMKINPSGTDLIYSTFIGRDGDETGKGIAVDGNENVYVAGYAFLWTSADVVITKINPAGTGLIYYRTYGGTDHDYGYSIAADGQGSAYITGETKSSGTMSGFPLKNPIYSKLRGPKDAFVLKVNSDGNHVYSTYLGGDGEDCGTGIAVTPDGKVWVGGWTNSNNFPTVNPLYSYKGNKDAFVTRISSDGKYILHSTYLGGSDEDMALGLAADLNNCVYITGKTASGANSFVKFPTTYGAFQASHGGGKYDGFVAKIRDYTPWTLELVYSTFFGGAGDDWANAIATDNFGNAFITGGSESFDLPLKDEFSPKGGFYSDTFVAEIQYDNSLIYSSFLGGECFNEGRGIAALSGSAYVTGVTNGNFPVFQNVIGLEPVEGGPQNVFISKVAPKISNYYHIKIMIQNIPHTVSHNNGFASAVILSDPEFFAAQVDPASVTLGAARVVTRYNGSPLIAYSDVNNDGLLDLILYFRARDLYSRTRTGGYTLNLEGRTFDGDLISGTDTSRLDNSGRTRARTETDYIK